MPSYKTRGTPAIVPADSNSAAGNDTIDNRLMGIPSTAPQSSLVSALITAWRNTSLTAYSLIDTVNLKVTTTDNGPRGGVFNAGVDSADHVVTFTADDASKTATTWAISDISELDAILGGDEGKGLWYGQLEDASKSLEAILNAIVNKASSMGKHVLIAVDQGNGTVKVGSFASSSAQTSAANTLRATKPADSNVFVTHEITPPEAAAPASGPNFGL